MHAKSARTPEVTNFSPPRFAVDRAPLGALFSSGSRIPLRCDSSPAVRTLPSSPARADGASLVGAARVWVRVHYGCGARVHRGCGCAASRVHLLLLLSVLFLRRNLTLMQLLLDSHHAGVLRESASVLWWTTRRSLTALLCRAMAIPRIEIDAMRIMLLDPRSDFYSMHPELPPLTIICKLRAVSHELCSLARHELEECWAMLKIHRVGAPLPLPLKKLLAKTQVEVQLMRYIQLHACDSERIVAGSFPLHRTHAGLERARTRTHDA